MTPFKTRQPSRLDRNAFINLADPRLGVRCRLPTIGSPR